MTIISPVESNRLDSAGVAIACWTTVEAALPVLNVPSSAGAAVALQKARDVQAAASRVARNCAGIFPLGGRRAMIRGDLLTIGAAVALSALCLAMPTVPHSWFMVCVAAAHIFVGVIQCLLWQRRGRWSPGWICLAAPSLLELAIFIGSQ